MQTQKEGGSNRKVYIYSMREVKKRSHHRTLYFVAVMPAEK